MSFKSLNLQSFARGDDWAVQYTMLDADTGLPIDITGNVYWLTLKENKTDADPGVAQVSVQASGQDASNGIITVAVEAAVTSNLTPGTYYYDLQEVDQIGNVYTLLIGRVKVVTDITISTV